MTITIEYEPDHDLTQIEEMTVYSIEKLLSGMTIEAVNQVLGKVATRMKSTTYQPPLNRFACGDWDDAVLRTVKDNVDKVAGEVAKKISGVCILINHKTKNFQLNHLLSAKIKEISPPSGRRYKT